MSDVPGDLRYTESDEWIRVEGNVGIVGLTDHAQKNLTDIVYVEPPEVGSEATKGSPFAIVESVKTAADVMAPVSGKVIAINEELTNQPELINQEPFGSGWIAKIEMSDSTEVESLLTSEQYTEKIEKEQH